LPKSTPITAGGVVVVVVILEEEGGGVGLGVATCAVLGLAVGDGVAGMDGVVVGAGLDGVVVVGGAGRAALPESTGHDAIPFPVPSQFRAYLS